MSESNKLKERFENINSKIWSTIEMTPNIWEILWTLYQEESVLVKDIEVLWKNKYKIKYVFPEYKLVKNKVDHVSGMQMQLAIFQWLFASIWLYIKNNPSWILNFDTFLKIRMDALYRRDQRTFTKKIKANQEAFLIFEITDIRKKWNIYSVLCKMNSSPDTFIRWEVECILEDKYI